MTNEMLKIAGMLRREKDIAAIGAPKYPEVYQRMGWSVENDLAYIRKALTTDYTGPGVQHNRRMKEKRLRDCGFGYLLEQPE
jgi:hypothetical protein